MHERLGFDPGSIQTVAMELEVTVVLTCSTNKELIFLPGHAVMGKHENNNSMHLLDARPGT